MNMSSDERIRTLERQLDRERRYNADLLLQNEELSHQLSKLGAVSGVEVGTQTEIVEHHVDVVKGETEWTIDATMQGGSIAESVKAFLTAKGSDIARKDFVYNEALGMYYNPENGMMYDGKRYLYYDYAKNAYLYYDEESGTYKEEEKAKRSTRKRSGKRKRASESGDDVLVLSDSEEGELDDLDNSSSPKMIPCIRMVVFRSECLSPGDLYIATSDRDFTIGRDAKRDMILSENLVSKYHAVIRFSPKTISYNLQDLGSQNGSFLNGERISEAKIVSEKKVLNHEDLLVVGSTTLVVHIHENADTCDNCEPGVAREKWKKIDQEESSVCLPTTPIRDLHKQQMLELKRKYGLQKDKFVTESPASSNSGEEYFDRAKVRRIVVGSEHQSHERCAEPASVHVPIPTENKGFKMLSKMGWNEGEGLNSRRTGDSINEPISIGFRVNETAGLGSQAAGEHLSFDDVKSKSKMEKWIKTAKRYEGLPTTSGEISRPPVGSSSAGASTSSQSGNIRWIRGGTVNPSKP